MSITQGTRQVEDVASCPRTRLARITMILMALSGTALAPAAVAAPACNVKSQNGSIVILVCPANASPEGLRDAGVAACKDRKPCNAWIWDDASKAPLSAPLKEADFPKSAMQEVRAVWMNDSQNLMTLRKVKN
jgi:hypothetical protein